jgi:hypothetical protein
MVMMVLGLWSFSKLQDIIEVPAAKNNRKVLMVSGSLTGAAKNLMQF